MVVSHTAGKDNPLTSEFLGGKSGASHVKNRTQQLIQTHFHIHVTIHVKYPFLTEFPQRDSLLGCQRIVFVLLIRPRLRSRH